MTKPTTMSHLRQWKLEQRKFSALTDNDASFAKLFSEQGVNVLLVGNSLSMTLQGHNPTLPVTVVDISYHTRAVRQGALAGSCRMRHMKLSKVALLVI